MSEVERERLQLEAAQRAGLLVVIVNLAVVAASLYLISRSLLVLEGITDIWSCLMTMALLFGEAFVMLHSISYSIDYVAACQNRPPPPREEIEDWVKAPQVAILIPARHEPWEVLEHTLICIQNLDYPNKTVYFLDDSSDPRYRKEAEELALTYGARLFRREDRHGAKAGIINDCIRTVEEDYVVIFDADQNPAADFLKLVMPVMLANPRLAFIQTPQFYTNKDVSLITLGANLQHCMFYEYVAEGKSARGAMILCGTNAVVRREALLAVGGLDEGSITEDFATSIDWHTQGWESLYYGHACVFGEGPTSLGAYFKQQWRWSRGNLGVLKKVIWYLLTRPMSMRVSQWWEYLSTGSYYLIGWAYFLLMLCPMTYVLFDTPSFFMQPSIYLLTFLPYFTLSFTIFYASMRQRNYRFRQLAAGVLLSFLSFPVYMKAAVSALLGLRAKFTVTEKRAGSKLPGYGLFWPQLLLWAIHFVALVWGVNRLVVEQEISVLMSMVWVFYHFMLLSSLFYFRRAEVEVSPASTDGLAEPSGV